MNLGRSRQIALPHRWKEGFSRIWSVRQFPEDTSPGLLWPAKVDRTWDIIGNWVICEMSKHDRETRRHIFGKCAESRKFTGEQAGGKEGLKDLGEWPGGSMARSILVPQLTRWT